ncbi:MAG TPA: ABC transporter substrate-binding protein [Streptosporangiaceae bacterium]|nr:ABC transporter substrate-binding protein [Streptosporangiaceae bacterium]
MKISMRFGASALLPVALAAACGGSAPGRPADGLRNVNVATGQAAPDITWIPYTIGITNGFYRAAGLSVSLVRAGGTPAVTVVAGGKADIGEGSTTDQVLAAGQGRPVISIANLSQRNNWGFFTATGKRMPTGLGLKGARVGVRDDTWTRAMLALVLSGAGLTAADIQQVPMSESGIPSLVAGRIDVATGPANLAPLTYAQATGKQPETLLATGAGAPDVPVWSYVANTQWLERSHGLAARWLAATARATEWAIAHPEDAVRAYEAYHKLQTSGYATDLAEWKATVPLLTNTAGLFTATDDQWTRLAQALRDTGQLEKVLPASAYYTNRYVTR